ncbi:hypothetical protein Hdeb2414_s1177g00989451 [Helianthus debilis subsp. tardiflorus]
MGQTPLDREWWGGVLGYCGDGFMHETVIRLFYIVILFIISKYDTLKKNLACPCMV